MSDYFLSASIRGTRYAAVKAALAGLDPPVREHHDINFEWCAPDMDVNLEAINLDAVGTPIDYLVSGYFECGRDEALARCGRLIDALERAGLVYRVELDDEESGENLLTKAHADFSRYRARRAD